MQKRKRVRRGAERTSAASHSPASFGEVSPPGLSEERSRDIAATIQRSTSDVSRSQPLAAETQRLFSARTGHDFANVRVHTDGEADQLARSLDAAAFTSGPDIFFRQGAFDPSSRQGKQLLAHEAVHTVQQTRNAAPDLPIEGDGISVRSSEDPSEQSARQMSNEMAGPQGSVAEHQSANATSAALSNPENHVLIQRAPEGDSASQRIKSLEQQQQILKKRQSALELDNQWRGKFMGLISSRKQAIFRITAGLDAASQNFQSTQIAQAQLDQLKVQLIGGIGAFGFAFGFEWAFTKELAHLGIEAKRIKDLVERWENPLNSAVSSSVNVAGSVQAIKSADEGKAPEEGTAVGFLAKNSEALEGHVKDFEVAFGKRAASMRGATDEQWEAFDIKTQEATYAKLYDALEKSGKGVEALKSESELALILERHLWALWIRGLREVELAQKEAARQSGSGSVDFDESKAGADYSSLGSEVEARLNKIGVASAAGVRLSEWSFIPNSSGYKDKLLNWANSYKDKIGVQ